MFKALFDTDALLFTVPALLGTALFLMKLGLMALGGFGDADVDADVDVDVDVDLDVDADVADAADAADSTSSFTFFSFQSIAAFLMGFGWGGLIGFVTLDWGVGRSIVAGVVFGAALMWLLGIVLKAVYDLQSSGHVRIGDAIGCDGTVYASIPAREEGAGQVRVVIGDRARFYNAVSDGDPLPTSTRVRVRGVNRDNTVTVSRV